ncbi:MAG: septum site-determining protein MinC [Desulfamplus sp.]|nr:septum site-determining protein MinC [Desulfamplus sp.]
MNQHQKMEKSLVTNEISAVKLRGVGDGFKLTLDPTMPEEVILKEITALFEPLKHLSVNTKVVLDIGNVQGYDNLIRDIKFLLKSRFDVGGVIQHSEKISGVGKDSGSTINHRSNSNKDNSRGWVTDRSDALILTGRVRSGQKIETQSHLIIAGNVNPGAELTAGGNIIVLGALLGQVYAGYPDDEYAFVMALDFRPTQVQIGGVVSIEINSEFVGKPVFATVKDNKIITEDYIKTQPFGKIQWPTVM